MAKRDITQNASIPNHVNDHLVISDNLQYTQSEQKRVQSIFPARLIYVGQISGKQYIWDKAGDVVDVNIEDVDDLLSKKLGEGSCCGSSQKGNPLFTLEK